MNIFFSTLPKEFKKIFKNHKSKCYEFGYYLMNQKGFFWNSHEKLYYFSKGEDNYDSDTQR